MKEFNQLCVWEGVTLGGNTPQDFEKWFLEQGFRIKYAEETKTLPCKAKNEEGGRTDQLFYIHDEDVMKFAIWRLLRGIRWWEDVISYNKHSYRYSKDILVKYPVTW
jgi:hypothetical protein